MKMYGKKISGPSEDIVVIPRQDELVEYDSVKCDTCGHEGDNHNPECQGKLLSFKGKRLESRDLVFKVRAVLDFTPFDKMCPAPLPPQVLKSGGERFLNVEDPKYKSAILEHGVKRWNWMILDSLSATEGLEWETIDPADSRTWGNLSDELKDSGLNVIEINHIIGKAAQVNSLDEKRLEEARNRFLALKGVQGK